MKVKCRVKVVGEGWLDGEVIGERVRTVGLWCKKQVTEYVVAYYCQDLKTPGLGSHYTREVDVFKGDRVCLPK